MINILDVAAPGEFNEVSKTNMLIPIVIISALIILGIVITIIIINNNKKGK